MPPDIYFVLALIVKMAVTAAFLLVATITAERAGPLIGGLVATLPISAGPVYIFLALDHDADFIAQSALGSLVTNAWNATFAFMYAMLAQKRSLAVSFGIALVVWIGLISVGGAVSWTLVSATALNIVVIAASFGLSAPLRHAPMPRVETRWYDLMLRAMMVALLVGTVVALSFRIGRGGHDYSGARGPAGIYRYQRGRRSSRQCCLRAVRTHIYGYGALQCQSVCGCPTRLAWALDEVRTRCFGVCVSAALADQTQLQRLDLQ